LTVEEAMPFSIYYDKKFNCIVVLFKGVLRPEEGKSYPKEAVRLGLKHGCKRILVDVREGQLDFSTTDIYKLSEMLDNGGLDRSWKRAVIASKQFEDFQFYETVMINRGYQLKIFSDPDEAMKWLNS
jgi:hypothetical protein